MTNKLQAYNAIVKKEKAERNRRILLDMSIAIEGNK